MIERLAEHRLLAVTGSSGSGKSSLVRAGLLQGLELGLLEAAGPAWRVASFRPRNEPMAALATALLDALGRARYEDDAALRQAALERGPLSLVEELHRAPLPEGGNLLILVDQFEELFRYEGLSGREEAEAFIALLLKSSGQRQVPIYVALTIRSDFIGECAQFEDLAERICDALYLCPRLTRDQIVAAIEGPASVFGGSVEPSLIARIVNDMGTDPDQLPLMQHALMRLWDSAQKRDPKGPVLLLADYLAADGIKGSLSRHADEILAEITRDAPDRHETVRRLFCLMIEGDSAERGIRRLARVSEVMAVSHRRLDEVAAIADHFRGPGRSLVMPPIDQQLRPETVLDISHETLIRQWQALTDWVRAEVASAEQYRETERRARRWFVDEADLWDATDLDLAMAWRERERPSAAWAARYGGDFNLAMRFLDASRARREAIDAERREHERRLIAAEEAIAREQAEAEAARLRRKVGTITKQFSTLTVLLLLALLLMLTARIAAPDLIDRLSLISFDLYQRAAPREAGDARIRIVDIDDKSLSKIGQWPWPRTVFAQLIDKLREAGAAVITFDIDFAEPDRTSPKSLLPLLTQSGVDAVEAEKLVAAMSDPDQQLAEAMHTVPVVTGFILSRYGETRPPASKVGFAFAGEDPLANVEAFPRAIPNLPRLEAAAAGNGFLNEYSDWDHVVRRVPLILKLGDQPYPSLAAEAVRLALGAHTYIGRAAGANGDKNFGEKTGLTAIRIGPVTVPTDAAGRVWLYYASPRRDRLVSAADVLAGKFDPALFAGYIVLVGISARGVINDLQATPIAADVPGVEVHAQLIEQMLQGGFLTRPDWAVGAEILFALLVGIGVILAFRQFGPLPIGVLGGVSATIAFGASWLFFRHALLLVDPLYPSVVISLVCLPAMLVAMIRQRRIRSAFSRYLAPRYVDELVAHPEKLKLGGEARIMTIMFCDIRGFASLSEKLDAESLTRFLNSFLSAMTEIITERKGTIDKYIGAGIRAFWNAPLDDPDHAKNAVRAAQEIRRKLVELNRNWQAEHVYRVFPPARVSIGINTGECVIGNFGSQQHFDYSLLGDPVHFTSRLESLGNVYGLDLMIGEETAARLNDPALIEVDLIAVKGKTQAGRVYTLLPDRVAEEQFIDQHSALLSAYRRQDWATATKLLDDGRLTAARFLAPVYDLYRRRIAQFQLEAPPATWSGVFTAEEK
jgi:adenylate cyclase